MCLPNDCFFLLFTSAVRDYVREGVAAVDNDAAQLRRIVPEIPVCAERPGYGEHGEAR